VGQDLVSGLGPDEGVAAFVPAVDEAADRGDEFLDAGEGSAADGLTGDDPEEERVRRVLKPLESTPRFVSSSNKFR